jgi:hypothetical protein
LTVAGILALNAYVFNAITGKHYGASWQGVAGLVVSSSQSSRKSRRTVALEDLALQERDSVFRSPSGGDWMLLGLVALGLIGTGLYDWIHLGIDDHTGRAVFFGLLLIAIFWGALVYIFKLSVSVLVGPHGISLVRGPWRTELFWRDTARLVERTLPDGGQRFRWVVVMARDGRELRVREDMVMNYVRFRAEVYERYLLWRDHGGTWGASGAGPVVASDVVVNVITWWLFAGALALLPGLYFQFLLPEAGWTGAVLLGVTAFCCLEALLTFLGRQTYSVGPKEITRKRPAQPVTRLRWRNVSRIDRTRHPAGGLIRVAIAIGRLLMEIAARTDSRFKSFAWSPRVPEYLTLRGEGRHVRIRLHRLTRPDEILAWVEYYERIGRRGENPSKPNVASQPAAQSASSSRPVARSGNLAGDGTPRASSPVGASGFGPVDPWAEDFAGELPADAYPTEMQPSVGAGRPPMNPIPSNAPADMPPSVAAAYIPIEDERPEGDSWLWDTSKMPKISGASSSSNIFAKPPSRPQKPASEPQTPRPTFTPPPTAGPAFTPPTPNNTPAETPWWLTQDQPASAPSWDAANSWQAADVYPPAGQPNYAPAPEYPPVYPPPEEDQQPNYADRDNQPMASPPFVQRPDYQQLYSEPPEEQGPSEHGVYDENLADSQKWRAQKNWQPPTLPRFGPPPPDDEDDRRKR